VHRNVFARYGVVITEEDHKNYWIRFSKGSEYVAKQHGLDYALIKPHMIEEQKRLAHKIQSLSYANELVDLLYSKFLLCVVSYSPRYVLENSIKQFGMHQKMKAIVAYEDVTNNKPHPEPYIKGVQLMGFKPDECVAIGDTEKDVISAKNAGLKVIAIPNKWTEDCDFSRADKVVKSLKDITLEMIREIGG
jgi:beta-phosphoglucomutase